MKVALIPILVGALGIISKGLVKEMEDLEIRDHPDYSIIKICQNTEKSPGDLRRPAVPQTPVRKIDVKNPQRSKIIIIIIIDFHKKLIFFQNKDTCILFVVKHYKIKMGIIRYYSL